MDTNPLTMRYPCFQCTLVGIFLLPPGSAAFSFRSAPWSNAQQHSTFTVRRFAPTDFQVSRRPPAGTTRTPASRLGTSPARHLSTHLLSLSSLHSDPSWCLSSLLLLSVFGITLEKRTVIGKALSAPLATMALALVVANVGLLPFESPVYSMTNRFLVSLAVPMLLYDSDVRRIVRETGALLVAFGLGALATLASTVFAFAILPLSSLQHNAHKVACALCARHIGGAINFVAVAETLDMSASVVSAAIAADNVVVALYFAALFYLAGPADDVRGSAQIDSTPANSEASSSVVPNGESQKGSEITLSTLSVAVATSSSLVTLGGFISRTFFPGASALPVTSLLTVLAATLRPNFFRRIRPAGTAIGILFIQMFFAASGASGSIGLVLKQAPSLFLFSALQILLHFLFLIGAGKFFRNVAFRELLLASNACVGGPTTAAAMAQAKQWTSLVLPALLIGILGYATATGVSLAMAPILLRVAACSR